MTFCIKLNVDGLKIYLKKLWQDNFRNEKNNGWLLSLK